MGIPADPAGGNITQEPAEQIFRGVRVGVKGRSDRGELAPHDPTIRDSLGLPPSTDECSADVCPIRGDVGRWRFFLLPLPSQSPSGQTPRWE